MGSPRTEQPPKRGFPVWVIVLVVVGFVVMPLATVVVVTGSVFDPKAAKISSRTDACAVDLQKGLVSLRDEQGLPFDVTDGDGRALLDGSIDKIYQRDGVRYTVSFQAEDSSGMCQLVFWRRVKAEPGSTLDSVKPFGQVNLPHCTCH